MFVNLEQAQERYKHCKSCENFFPDLKICKKCGCFMPLKVTIGKSECPIKIWKSTTETTVERKYDIND
jgi:hypothetical protein